MLCSIHCDNKDYNNITVKAGSIQSLMTHVQGIAKIYNSIYLKEINIVILRSEHVNKPNYTVKYSDYLFVINQLKYY